MTLYTHSQLKCSCSGRLILVVLDSCNYLDILVILDTSGTIEREATGGHRNNWEWMIEASQKLVDLHSIGPLETQIGVVIFGNNGKVKIALDEFDNAADLNDRLSELDFKNQRTNLIGGLQVAREDGFSTENGARTDAGKIAILMYDGEPPNTDSMSGAMIEAPKLKEFAEVYVLTLNYYFEYNLTTDDLVKEIASEPPDTHLFFFNTYESAIEIMADIKAENHASCSATLAPVTIARGK